MVRYIVLSKFPLGKILHKTTQRTVWDRSIRVLNLFPSILCPREWWASVGVAVDTLSVPVRRFFPFPSTRNPSFLIVAPDGVKGIDPQIKELFYKLASVQLCPPVQGQILVDLAMKPPADGDPSYPLYKKEVDGIYESLQRRAKRLVAALNTLEGVTCNAAQGAMYLFPQIKFSTKALEAAKAQGKTPDSFYCMALLNATGVCVVPGSGFCQKEGTWHFRSTFLPPEAQLDGFIQRIQIFHRDFCDKYRDE